MDRFYDLEDLVPDVMIHIPECPNRVVLHALHHAIFRFLEKTRLWQATVTGDLTADSANVSLDLSTIQGIVEDVLNLRLKSASTDDFDDLTAELRGSFSCDEDGAIVLNSEIVPSTTITDGCQAECVFLPNMHSGNYPSIIFSRHSHAVINAAIAYLKLSPGKPYTDIEGAAIFQLQYNIDLTNAMNSITRRGSNAIRGFHG